MVSRWSSLSADILYEISCRLSTEADYLHVHQVCAHWRASTSLPPFCRRPWIIAGRPRPLDSTTPAGVYSAWLLNGVRRVDGSFPPPPAGVPCCCGMPRGWLALSDHDKSPTRLILWDPTSAAEIALPPLNNIVQVFLSDDPLVNTTASPSSPSWVALASQRRGEVVQRMYFWRPGDESWSLMMVGENNSTVRVESLAFHDGKVFFTDHSFVLVIYDLNAHPPTRVRMFSLHREVTPLCRCRNFHIIRTARVVACQDELLLVVLHGEDHPRFAEIYKPPDWTTAERGLELGGRVTDLRGYALFLGQGDTFALRADDYPWIRRNHIYFLPHSQASQIYWLLMFDLDSGVLQRYPCPQKHREEEGNKWWPYSWFCPKRLFFKE